MTSDFLFHYFSFQFEAKAPLLMPAYNKGNVIRGGFGSAFRRIVCDGDRREARGMRRVCVIVVVLVFVCGLGAKIARVCWN